MHKFWTAVGLLVLVAACAPVPYPMSTATLQPTATTPTARELRAQERATLIATMASSIDRDCSHALEVPTSYPPQDSPGPTSFTSTQLFQLRECMNRVDWFAGQGKQAFLWDSVGPINMNNRDRRIDFPYYPMRPGVRQAIEAILIRIRPPLPPLTCVAAP